MPHPGPRVMALVLLAGLGVSSVALGQSKPGTPNSTHPDRPAVVGAVRMVADKDGPAVEILASRPVVPAISRLEQPPRLVIDLPNAKLTGVKKRIDFRSEDISGVRLNQYQESPPLARIVVDLLNPVTYTWDAAGNRLMIRMHPAPRTAASAPAASTPHVQLAVLPVTTAVTSGRLPANSSLTAGADAAVFRLAHGGEVRVCPGTTVSVTSSQTGQSLMLGMSTGSLEAHYTLQASADSILTPDFRILLPGPGEFHYAVSADARGNTCVRSLPGNTASAIVAELLGDGTYQVKPNEQVVFHAGRLSATGTDVPADCGCPPPAVPVLQASVSKDVQGTAVTGVEPAASPSLNSSPAGLPTQITAAGNETAALPPSKPNDVHVEVEAPFVFRGGDPPPIAEAESVPLAYAMRVTPPPATVLPPAAQHHGVFGKIKGFFAAIFR